MSEIPVILIDSLNHFTVMGKPTEDRVNLVRQALTVKSEGELKDWMKNAEKVSADPDAKKKWQQFVVRMLDERGDPIPDYNVRLASAFVANIDRGEPTTREACYDQRIKSAGRLHANAIIECASECAYMWRFAIPALQNGAIFDPTSQPSTSNASYF